MDEILSDQYADSSFIPLNSLQNSCRFVKLLAGNNDSWTSNQATNNWNKKMKTFMFVLILIWNLGYGQEGSIQKNPSSENSDTTSTEQIKIYRKGKLSYLPDRVIVKFRETVSAEAVQSRVAPVGVQVVETLPVVGAQLCRVKPGMSVEATVDTLKKLSGVEYVEPDYIVYALEIPNDPDFTKLWGLNNEGQSGGIYDADIDAPEAWNKEKGKKDIIVSIIDTGIDYDHPDLKANIWKNTDEIPGNGIDDDHNGYVDDYYGWDFANNDNNPIDDNDHGTHVAGTIGAVGNNGRGVVGVNWRVRLMALKFLNADGSGSTSDAVKAIIYAVDNGANILSNSWGGSGNSRALKEAIEYAYQKGVLFVAAAGNESRNNDVHPNYPSNYDVENVIAVAATDDRDQLATFSNYGPITVDLAAPGVAIYSTVTGNRYKYFSGTSMATPHVSGAAALVWAYYLPRANSQFVKYKLFGAVDYVRNLEGYLLLDGRLNVNSALSDSPLVAVIRKPQDTDNTQGPYTVQASAVDNDTITSVQLFYKVTNQQTNLDTLAMAQVKKYVYQAEIPGAPVGSVIEYKVIAIDNQGNETSTSYRSFVIKKKPGGCCGSMAATVEVENSTTSALLSLILNALLIFLPLYLIGRKLKP